jgi:GWxTD domain-containing protein
MFDSALTAMTEAERSRIDRITRIRPPTADTTILSRGTPAEREAMRRVYWLLANPLWSQSVNLPRVEYFARAAFADLRWTVDEANVRGADTDRGNVYIRYGPPNTIGVMHPAMRDMADTPNGGELTTVWVYKAGLMFVFRGALSFATAETAPDDRRLVTEIFNSSPVRWDNVTIPAFDSIPTQIARFRATADSVDVYAATAPNVSAIRAPVSGAPPVVARAWWVAPNSSVAFRDSTTMSSGGVAAWSHRLRRGGYVLRTEATAEQAERAGRTTLVVDAGSNPSAFPATGFGISDLLVAAGAAGSGRAGERWKDLSITSMAEAVKSNASIALVWENYDFGVRDGTAQYDVVVTLTRARSTGARVGAAVVGALASVARIDRRDDRVTITINRTAPHAPAFADVVNVSLQETPPGEYDLVLRITDRISGKIATSNRRFVITP